MWISGKLIEAKENIEKLRESFEFIQQEIGELDEIIGEYDSCERENNRLLADDIRIVYKKKKELKREIERQNGEREAARRRKEDLEKELDILERRQKEIDSQLVQVRVGLEQLDSTRMIAEESRRAEELQAEQKTLMESVQKTGTFSDGGRGADG